jgi:hypothetical protein
MEAADLAVSLTDMRNTAARDGGPLWLDFDHTDEDSMELLRELIDVRPMSRSATTGCRGNARRPETYRAIEHLGVNGGI